MVITFVIKIFFIPRFTLDPVSGVQTVVWEDQGEGDNDRPIILSHPEILQRIPQINRIGIDATFKSSPDKYYQVRLLML